MVDIRCLLVWGTNTRQSSRALAPTILLVGGIFVVAYAPVEASKSVEPKGAFWEKLNNLVKRGWFHDSEERVPVCSFR